ncbi:hypothetical protein SV7mr_49470 [Stieleria bergensis]|uniref:Uncharacterized protein n=1 Tax=Stieleria bergensis TaxID=2528025 RepID=A0A517T200_9BACT|nr:hypothetical protein SV7mr_49470 [Planctomycetes bacterium SV_7m_r]
MPRHSAAFHIKIALVRGSSTDSSRFELSDGDTSHEAVFLLEQWQQLGLEDEATELRDLVTLATRNSGGVTPLRSAHANFSRSVWQQHLSQQYSALEHPHGQFSQGKRSADRPAGGFAEGTLTNPVSAKATESSKSHKRPCLALQSRIESRFK